VRRDHATTEEMVMTATETTPARATKSRPRRATAATRNRTWVADEGHPRRWWVLAVLAAVAFMAQLDLFVVNIAVPAIGHSFGGAGLSSVSWVLNGYAIVFAALLVPAGRLADHFGRRRFLLVGVVIFTAASALCAIAPDLGVLVIGRIVQAVGAALIVPTSLGLLLPAFAQRQHTLVVGIWAGVASVAASSGPPVGGLLVGIDWRWIFLINVPIGLATVLIGYRVLPEVRAQRNAHLPDVLSAVTLLAAITLLILATVQGPTWGWGSAATVSLLVAATLSAGATVMRTLRHPDAVIEKALFRSREFTAASVALFLFYVAFAVWLLITVLFLQDLWHYSAVRAGLAISPGPLTAALFAVNNGRITARVGRAVPAVVGTLLVAGSCVFWLSAASAHPSYAATFLPGLILAGAGAGLAQAPLFSAASRLPAERATTGSAVLNMSRQVGSAVGVAVLVALLASPSPGTIGPYRRGWILEIATALGAAAAILVLRPRRAGAP
jgi:EmrB/QacA subfamily drug resistance transporter